MPIKVKPHLSKGLPTVFAKSSSAGYRVNRLSIWHFIRRLSRIWQDWSRPFEGSVYCCPLLSCSNWMPRCGPTSTLHKLLIYSKYSLEKAMRQWWQPDSGWDKAYAIRFQTGLANLTINNTLGNLWNAYRINPTIGISITQNERKLPRELLQNNNSRGPGVFLMHNSNHTTISQGFIVQTGV